MPYLSPPEPSDYETKCAVIYYPADDGRFYLSAIRGALSSLTKRFAWEGDAETKDEISQIWLKHDMMTDDSFFAVDCEIIDALIEDGEMAINVNVNQECGCCGGGGGTVVNVTQGDTNVPVVFNPEIEIPEGVPPTLNPNDPETPEPPEPIRDNGIETWEEYDESACRIANYLAQLPPRILRAGETAIDEYTTVAAVYTLLASILPPSWFAKLGSNVFGQLIDDLAELVVIESAGDVLQSVAEDYENEIMEDMVCALYESRYTLGGNAAVALSDVAQWLSDKGITGVIGDTLYNTFAILWQERILIDNLLGAITTPPSNLVDCSTCEADTEWFIDFGALDGGWSPEFGPDATGRVVEFNRAVNFAPNDTFPVVFARSDAPQPQANLNGNVITRIEMNLSSWNDPQTPAATAFIDVRLFNDQNNTLETVQFVTLAEYPTFQKNGNTNDLDSTRTIVSKDFSGLHSPARIEITAVNQNGGAAQFQVGWIRIFSRPAA